MKVALVLAGLLTIVLAQDIQNRMLQLHNYDRWRHQAGGLQTHPELVRRAQKCAKLNADRGYLRHDCPDQRGLGENLAGGSSLTADSAYSMWYKEEKYYNYDDARFSGETGHFTQVVWNDTQYLGCGYARGKNTAISCLYYKPGNVQGAFQQNVRRPIR